MWKLKLIVTKIQYKNALTKTWHTEGLSFHSSYVILISRPQWGVETTDLKTVHGICEHANNWGITRVPARSSRVCGSLRFLTANKLEIVWDGRNYQPLANWKSGVGILTAGILSVRGASAAVKLIPTEQLGNAREWQQLRQHQKYCCKLKYVLCRVAKWINREYLENHSRLFWIR